MLEGMKVNDRGMEVTTLLRYMSWQRETVAR